MTDGLIIYCTQELRDRWPVSLARLWRNDYPNLFDDDDVRLSRLQPRNHFNEWFAAIYVFHSRGLLSLIEEYRRSHPRKKPIFERLLSFDQRQLLNTICASCGVQQKKVRAIARREQHEVRASVGLDDQSCGAPRWPFARRRSRDGRGV